jgi:tetratricopeptide (TPR) repeat protein
MDLEGRSVALYGRFSASVRDRMQRQIVRGGGTVARDLTRRTDLFVVGALATTLIDSGALTARLSAARARDVPVLGERAFAAALAGGEVGAASMLPLATALKPTSLAREDADLLAAFDLIVLDGEACRFGDAGAIRTADTLIGRGRSRGDVIRILRRARDLSPTGRHSIVLTAAGEAALQWDDGLTTLEGQGVLPIDEHHAGIEDLFEAAAIAEAEGDLADAARLYDMCARADRKDAIALYNYANIRRDQGEAADAQMAYQRALARDPSLLEARYNLAQTLEAAGRIDDAVVELTKALDADPAYADAVFNLAQLRMKLDQMEAAKALYERYLTLDPPEDWAATARKAITYCVARLSA